MTRLEEYVRKEFTLMNAAPADPGLAEAAVMQNTTVGIHKVSNYLCFIDNGVRWYRCSDVFVASLYHVFCAGVVAGKRRAADVLRTVIEASI